MMIWIWLAAIWTACWFPSFRLCLWMDAEYGVDTDDERLAQLAWWSLLIGPLFVVILSIGYGAAAVGRFSSKHKLRWSGKSTLRKLAGKHSPGI